MKFSVIRLIFSLSLTFKSTFDCVINKTFKQLFITVFNRASILCVSPTFNLTGSILKSHIQASIVLLYEMKQFFPTKLCRLFHAVFTLESFSISPQNGKFNFAGYWSFYVNVKINEPRLIIRKLLVTHILLLNKRYIPTKKKKPKNKCIQLHTLTQSKPSFCAHADNDTKYMYTIRGALQNYKHLSGTLQRGKLW